MNKEKVFIFYKFTGESNEKLARILPKMKYK